MRNRDAHELKPAGVQDGRRASDSYDVSMKDDPISKLSAKLRATGALAEAFRSQHPDIALDLKGYARDFRETLLPLVSPEDFEDDLSSGDGNELGTKFRAAHSSSGLAVNCFAPFKRRIPDLVLPEDSAFDTLQFERKCPTGLRGGRVPNLDVVLVGQNGVVAIESKLTEYLSGHRAEFSPAYEAQITDARCEQGYFREMLRLRDQPDHYKWLDAAQLIKHAFGLARTFPVGPVTLLYLFWEPANPEVGPEFAAHRAEIEEFKARAEESSPAFQAMSYPELWQFWRDSRSVPEWLQGHLESLKRRYLVRI